MPHPVSDKQCATSGHFFARGSHFDHGVALTLLAHMTGKRTLIARGGSEGNSTVLEIWIGNRVTKELQVPKKLHGTIFNDGWFGLGAAWSQDESRVAYVAEVSQLSSKRSMSNTAAADFVTCACTPYRHRRGSTPC